MLGQVLLSWTVIYNRIKLYANIHLSLSSSITCPFCQIMLFVSILPSAVTLVHFVKLCNSCLLHFNGVFLFEL